jgi:signal transduction histidine kinase
MASICRKIVEMPTSSDHRRPDRRPSLPGRTRALVLAGIAVGVGTLWSVMWIALSRLVPPQLLSSSSSAFILVGGAVCLPALTVFWLTVRSIDEDGDPSLSDDTATQEPPPPPPEPAPVPPRTNGPAEPGGALVRTLVDNLPEGIVLLGGDGEVLIANPQGVAYLHEFGTFVGAVHLALFGGIPVAQLFTPSTSAWKREITVTEPFQQTLEVSGQQIAVDHKITGGVMVIRDVTADRQQRIRLERSDRLAAVGQLAAGISHDFKNILQGINLCAEMSKSRELSSTELRDNMATIIEQSNLGSKMIQQIMDFTRQSTSTQKVFDLADLMKSTVELLRPGIPENIEIDLTIVDDELSVMADFGKTQQSLANLIFNSRDAMPDGGRIMISACELDAVSDPGPMPPEVRQGIWARIIVEDTGHGIPESIQRRVFEPFFTTKSTGSGTGLGLAQVFGNIRQHGGHIEFESAEGIGTTFFVFLPLYRYHHDEREATGMDDAELRGRGETVLVVEDDLAVLTTAAESLRQLGYKVLEAVDGRDGLEMFGTGSRIDLVLTDVHMPGMGGQELAQELWRRRPGAKILMMSAHLMDEEDGEPHFEADGFLSKPFTIAQLAREVRRILGTGQARSSREVAS